MRKLIVISFIIGCCLCLLDVDNMTVFLLSKVVGLLMIMPMFKLKFGE